MADSTTPIDQLSTATANNELRINELIDAASPAMIYGRRAATTTGLIWGYFGGRVGGSALASGTVTLTGSATNYLVADASTGLTVSVATTTTNWNDTANFIRLYKIVTGSSSVSSYEDHRDILSGGAGGGGVGDASTNTSVSVNSEVALFSGTGGKTLKRATGSGLALLTSGVLSAIPALQVIPVACGDETTAITAGTGKVTFINPFSTAFVVAGVVASLTTAQTSGSIFTVDINEAGTSILSTKLTIDNTEKNSSTAATAAVISDASIAAYAEITIDVDQVGDGTAKGLKVYLLGWPA